MKKDIRSMRLVVIFLAISSFSLLMVGLCDYDGSLFNKMMAVVVGLLFWGFLIAGYVIFGSISRHRKEYEKNIMQTGPTSERRRLLRKKRTIGLLCFFSDPYAMAADVLTALLLVINLVLVFIPNVNQFVELIFFSGLIYAVQMHCILNGLNYQYTKEISKKKKN